MAHGKADQKRKEETIERERKKLSDAEGNKQEELRFARGVKRKGKRRKERLVQEPGRTRDEVRFRRGTAVR